MELLEFLPYPSLFLYQDLCHVLSLSLFLLLKENQVILELLLLLMQQLLLHVASFSWPPVLLAAL